MAALFVSSAFSAQLPVKHYAATNLPPELDGSGTRLDDAGKVFGTGRTIPTEFLIYDPAATDANGVSVRHIPSPPVPNLRRFGIVDINQKGQFITLQSPQQGNGHNFLWDGGKFVEFKPLPPDDEPLPDFTGYPNLVASWLTRPESIHDDGSIWGFVSATFGKANDFGSEIRWDLSGKPTVMFAFRSENDPLRVVGSPRNEKGSFLRWNERSVATGLLITNTAYWDGMSATLSEPIPHPPSVAVQLNDLDEVAGITAATREIWLYLPSPNYGLSKGYHLLSGVTAASQPGLFFNNAGQIFVATTDTTQPLAVWEKGLWRAAQVNDPDLSGLEIRTITAGNARGALLAFLSSKGPPAPLKQYVLTPSTNLTVTSYVTPIRMDIGDTFDLQLDIRNDTPVPLTKIGIVVSTLGFSGAVVGDWIKAPPSLLSLAPDASGTLHYIFRAKAAGKAQLRYQVEGLNAAGQRQTITARLTSPIFTVLADKGDLLLKRAADPASQFALDNVYQTIPAGGQVVTNSTTANTASQFQIQIQNDSTNSATFHLNAIESGATGWDIQYFSGSQNISADVRTLLGVEFPKLAPKQAYLVDVSMTPTNAPVNSLARAQIFLSVTNVNAQLMTLDAVEAVSQRVDAAGDLLVRRISEPTSAFGLDNVYQAQPSGLQVRTNVADQNVLSEFELQIQNDAKVPQTFRLTVNESSNDGWKPAQYIFDGNDISARLRAAAGYDFPVLGTNKSYLLRARMTPTNAIPGSQFRASFALSTTNTPAVTLDAAEVVTEVPFAIIVNSTRDLPLDPSVTCCCDTGEKLADGVTAECTLRAAIEIANQHDGKDTIQFQIPSDDPNYNSGVPLIRPKTELPPVNDAAIIDGWSQNSSSLTPPVEVNGLLIPRPAIIDEHFSRDPNDNHIFKIPGPKIVDWPGAASGFTAKAPGTEIRGLAVTHFPLCGLKLEGGDSIVQGCYVGLAPDGFTSKVNGVAALDSHFFFRGCGILVSSPGNQIGGSGSKQGNVISGNRGSVYCEDCANGGPPDVGPGRINQFPQHTGPGILILGQSARGNRIQGNILGPDHTGNRLLAPSPLTQPYRGAEFVSFLSGQAAGVVISDANNNEVGGLLPGEGNVIGGTILGVFIEEGVSVGNVIRGNSIGIGADGISTLRNQVGVAIGASQNTVGGDIPDARNLISASDIHGIIDMAGCRIQGNWIGVNAGGGKAADQQKRGIVITGPHSLVVSNIIAFSEEHGVFIYGSGDASLFGNRIFGNGLAGVEVAGVERNKISQNQIVGNGLAGPAGLAPAQSGIDLEGSHELLLNDDFDLDSGSNTLLNYPIIGTTQVDPSGLVVAASLDTSLGVHAYTIEFFANAASAPSGYGEGERFLGSVTVNTDVSGRAGIDFMTTAPVQTGEYLTATATDAVGNTSEFSQAVMIQGSISTFSKKGISDAVQQKVPRGHGSLHLVSGNTSGQLQLQGGAGSAFLPLQLRALPQATGATGDGNGDGIQDHLQPNVVSFPGIAGQWITLASPRNTALENVSPAGPPDFTNLPPGYTFPLGFVNFTVTGLAPGGSVTVTNFFHDAIDYDTVFAYGPTPENLAPHYYEFQFNGSVGATLDTGGFTLTFSDGGWGDHDLKTDGQIITTLAAAHRIPPGPQLSLLSTSVSIAPRIDFTPAPNGGFELVTNQVPVVTSVLAWPTSATNYSIQFTDSLSPTNVWQLAFTAPATLNNQNVITNTAANTLRYYRLRRY